MIAANIRKDICQILIVEDLFEIKDFHISIKDGVEKWTLKVLLHFV